MEAYLDNSATTQPCKEAVDKMNYALKTCWGNPSSLHAKGIAASELIEDSRRNVAKALSCESSEIYFTSGGTESNNIAVFGAANAQKRRGSRIITTSIEHSSIEESVKALENQGYDVVRLRVNERGVIDERQLYAATNPSVVLISMMYVNNEIGSIQPVEFAKRAVTHSGANALVHCDAVQAFGKVQLKPYNMGVDLMSIKYTVPRVPEHSLLRKAQDLFNTPTEDCRKARSVRAQSPFRQLPASVRLRRLFQTASRASNMQPS